MNAPSDRSVPAAAGTAAQGEPTEPSSGSASGAVDLHDVHQVFADHEIPPEEPTVTDKVKTLLVGKPLDLEDLRVYQHISLVAFLNFKSTHARPRADEASG